MITLRTGMLAAAIAFAATSGTSPPAYATDALALATRTLDQAPDLSTLPHHQVQLKRPPFVHDHDQVAKGGPSVVQFTLPIVEQEIVIDGDGTKMHAMTFGGSIPAKTSQRRKHLWKANRLLARTRKVSRQVEAVCRRSL